MKKNFFIRLSTVIDTVSIVFLHHTCNIAGISMYLLLSQTEVMKAK